MVLVTSSKRHRLLHINYIGDVQLTELREALPDVVALLAELPAGFRVLGDFSGLDSMHPDCASVIGEVMELCEQKGVGLVLRVIPDPTKDIGLKILGLFHYRQRPLVVTCETVKEAIEKLGQA